MSTDKITAKITAKILAVLEPVLASLAASDDPAAREAGDDIRCFVEGALRDAWRAPDRRRATTKARVLIQNWVLNHKYSGWEEVGWWKNPPPPVVTFRPLPDHHPNAEYWWNPTYQPSRSRRLLRAFAASALGALAPLRVGDLRIPA